MGASKATLPFGDELMVQRVTRLLSEVASPLVAVAAVGQELPSLPANVRIARDAREDRGPLEGLAAGLRAVAGQVDAVYVTSCDVPLLVPDFVTRLYQLLEESDEIVVPRDDRFHHPLAAIYRTRVLSAVDDLLRADRLRTAFLFQSVRIRQVPVESLRDVDPDLDTLKNLNRPEDYLAAVKQAGLAVPVGIAGQLRDPGLGR